MNCPNCHSEMKLKQRYCPQCGQEVIVEFNALAQSVHSESAIRRGDKIETALHYLFLAMLIAGAVIYCVNDMYDKPLCYDGAALPALPLKDAVSTEIIAPQDVYTDPRPMLPLPTKTTRVFGHRKEPVRNWLSQVNNAGRLDAGAHNVSKAVADGLNYLARSQQPDGHWQVNITPKGWDQWHTKEFQWGETAVTGLALLAFLGDGQTWLPDEHTGKKDLHASKILSAARWLLNNQDADTGRFGPPAGAALKWIYNHGIGTLAITEAAGLTGDEILRAAAQKGVNLIISSQNDDGGWNYQGQATDVIVSAWQAQALWTGREIGLNVPETALSKALDFYKSATVLTRGNARVIYSPKAISAADRAVDLPSRCGVALMLRQLLGESRRAPELIRIGQQLLQSQLPSVKPEWGRGWAPLARAGDDVRANYDPYAIYYYTYGLFFLGGKDWECWNEALRKAVVDMQDNDGAWRANDNFTKMAGFNYATALSILTLQVYYRIQ